MSTVEFNEELEISQFKSECMRYMFGDPAIDPKALAVTIKAALEAEEHEMLEDMGDGFLEAVTHIYDDSIKEGDDEVIKQLVLSLGECRATVPNAEFCGPAKRVRDFKREYWFEIFKGLGWFIIICEIIGIDVIDKVIGYAERIINIIKEI